MINEDGGATESHNGFRDTALPDECDKITRLILVSPENLFYPK
jgi:hypothetical protein